jgi:hypothetical protein
MTFWMRGLAAKPFGGAGKTISCEACRSSQRAAVSAYAAAR